MAHTEKVVYWLVDFIIPSFRSKFGRDEIQGRVLIASRQLWSLISEVLVRSALIGPGYVKGVIKKAKGDVEFEQAISGMIFDPTELRPREPLPLVNIISPEVIDPLAESSKEEIESRVRKIVISRGKHLVTERLAQVKPLTSVPIVEHVSTAKVKLEIRFTGGLAKAKFALGGVHRRIYAPYASNLSTGKYDDINSLKMLWVDKRELVSPSKDVLSNWIIIEQSAERVEPEEAPPDGYTQIMNEYKRTIDFMKANISSYIFV